MHNARTASQESKHSLWYGISALHSVWLVFAETTASTASTVETNTEAVTEEEPTTLLSLDGVEVETAALSGDGRMHSQVNSLYLIALTLLGALIMLR